MHSRRITFAITPLLVLVISVCSAFYMTRSPTGLVDVVPNPIVWIPFTQTQKDTLVGNGKTVLVFGKPGYHAGAESAANTFNDPELQKCFYSGRFVAMILEYDDWQGEEVRELFKKHGHTKHPIALLYVPNHNPIKVAPYSAADILKHLRSTSKPQSK